MILTSVKVSILALFTIFLVLSILIGVIKLLVYFIPYQAPPVQPAKPRPAQPSGGEEEVAAIHAALAHHLGKSPGEIHIRTIQSL